MKTNYENENQIVEKDLKDITKSDIKFLFIK